MSLSAECTVLLLLISGLSAVIVLPPTNVRVMCQNLKTSVHWDYRAKEPQTVFRGIIHPRNCTFETTDHEYDLSNCIWKAQGERYLSFMYVSISAIQGSIQSRAEKSNTFSFNTLKTVDTKCSLDFPVVEIKAKEQMATVSFQNPFYKEMTQEIPPEYQIDFTVYPVGNTKRAFQASCTKKICECNVPFNKSEKMCVTLKGTLFVRTGAQQVELNNTSEICSTDFKELMLAAVLSSLLLFVLIVAFACICKIKAWTFQPSDPLPSSLKGNGGHPKKPPPNPPRPHISRISLESLDNSCQDLSEQTALFKDTGHPEDTHHSPDNSSAGSDYNPHNCCYAERPHLDSSDSDRSRTDDDSGDDSVKTECVSIEERSAYDCPHVMVDMGDGDMVTGYTGN